MKKKKYLTAYHHELEKNAEDIALLLPKGLITLEGGEDILHIFHKKNFSERLAGIRKHILSETGFIPPFIKFSSGTSCRPGSYLIKIKNVYVAGGDVYPDKLLLMAPPDVINSLDGIKCYDPVYNSPALWVDRKGGIDKKCCNIFDAMSVIATNIAETVRKHIYELFEINQTDCLLEIV
ncbi:MAG: FHIPEP family type III secretion protein [Candidatus Eremiobacterota bacterium]